MSNRSRAPSSVGSTTISASVTPNSFAVVWFDSTVPAGRSVSGAETGGPAGAGSSAAGAVPHPAFIGGYGVRATPWLIVAIPYFVAAVALVPRVLRMRLFPLALFVGTL